MASLTDREFAVLCAVCAGDSSSMKEAGRDLFVTEKTVKNHLTSVYRKLTDAGAIPERSNKKTLACVWLWRVKRAATGNGA